ncbi:MAG TPA: aminoglycoside phosphotransferase family protein, partial [Streptosporangiaceae bacterium]|nr:aminoglycoside phosphotransferase family protein [Streptosporangiaceae bacterium]
MNALVSAVVREKAKAAGAASWLDALPDIVADLEHDWSITIGRPYETSTEAFMAEAALHDGTLAVLKLMIPRPGDHARNEITVLKLTAGDGCARLLRDDEARGALLVERLGPSLDQHALPIAARHEILCAAAERVWRPAPGCGLPTGADKGPLAGRLHHGHLGKTGPPLYRTCRRARAGLRRAASRRAR